MYYVCDGAVGAPTFRREKMNNFEITIGTRVTIPALPASEQKTGTVVSLSKTYDYTDATVRWDDGTTEEIDTGWLAVAR